MASHNYIVGFLKYYQFNTLLIEPTPTIRHRRVIRIPLWSGKNSTLKSNDHEFESYNKFKNFLLKITLRIPWQIEPWGIFSQAKPFLSGTIFCECHICLFQMEYLSFAICKVPLFSNGIKGCHFCWVYLMVVKL